MNLNSKQTFNAEFSILLFDFFLSIIILKMNLKHDFFFFGFIQNSPFFSILTF